MLGYDSFSANPPASLSSGLSVRFFGTAEFLPFFKRIASAFAGSARLTIRADNRIFAATDDFVSRPSDRLPSRPFPGTVRQALRFTRSILGSDDFSAFTLGLGEMILVNASGEYDGLIGSHALDGRPVTVKLGERGGAYDAFGTIFAGQSSGYRINGEEFIVELRDLGYVLEVPASPNVYAGTGGAEGGEEFKGRRKPRCFGRVMNVTPANLSPASTSLHQVNDGPVAAIPAVYVRGVAMTLQADFPTLAGLLAATVQAGKFATCLAAGCFRVTANPQERGAVTADVQGDASGTGFVTTTAGIIRRLVTLTAGVSALDEPSFAALEAAYPSAIGFYLPPGSEDTVAEVAGALMLPLGGWAGHKRNGTFEVGLLRAPAGRPIARYTEIEIIDIDREALPDAIEPPAWRYRLGYGRNWTVQNEAELAGVVLEDEARVAFLAEAFRVADPAEDLRVKANHPLAQDPEVIESFFHKAEPAAAEALRRLRFLRSARSLYRMTLKTQPFLLDLGSEIAVTYPRWDLAEGKALRVVSLDEDTENNMVDVVAFG